MPRIGRSRTRRLTRRSPYRGSRTRSPSYGPRQRSMGTKYGLSTKHSGNRIIRGAMNPSQMVKLRYVDTFTLNPGVGTIALHQFRANSLFDPDLTLGGHQPLGFNQWEILFDHYTVTGSKISVDLISTTSNGLTGPALVGILLDDDGTVPTDPNTFREQNKSTYKTLGNSNGPKGQVKLVKTFGAKRYFGVSDVDDNTTRIGALMGANPADSAIYTVWSASINAAEDAAPLICQVTIEYTAKLTEAVDIDGST